MGVGVCVCLVVSAFYTKFYKSLPVVLMSFFFNSVSFSYNSFGALDATYAEKSR